VAGGAGEDITWPDDDRGCALVLVPDEEAAALAPGLVAGADVDGESLGVGVLLPVPVEGDGDGLGDELGEGDVLGDGLDDFVRLDDGDELGLAEPGRQLRDGWGEPVAPGPIPAPEVDCTPFEWDDAGAPPRDPLWPKLPEGLAGVTTAGSAVMSHDAAATTKIPVASAAAGLSQPRRPGRSWSGRKRSTTAPDR